MDVKVLYFEGCPSWTVAVERLRSALDATGHEGTPIQTVRVGSAADIGTTGFAGSPTVIVDGQDLFPGAAPVGELTCRLYPTSEGLHGSPTEDAFIGALTQLSALRQAAHPEASGVPRAVDDEARGRGSGP